MLKKINARRLSGCYSIVVFGVNGLYEYVMSKYVLSYFCNDLYYYDLRLSSYICAYSIAAILAL